MFKKNIMLVILYCFSVSTMQASLKIAIPACDFRTGNSLVLITRDGNGFEQVAGCVSLAYGKIKYSHDEISCHNQTLSSITDQESKVCAQQEQDQVQNNDESLIYLYFDVNPDFKIVRVLVIKNNLLADNPYDVVEFSLNSLLDEDEDDEDDFFNAQDKSELSNFNLIDIQGTDPVALSNYDKMMLAACALWAVQTTNLKQTYKKFTIWLASHYA